MRMPRARRCWAAAGHDLLGSGKSPTAHRAPRPRHWRGRTTRTRRSPVPAHRAASVGPEPRKSYGDPGRRGAILVDAFHSAKPSEEPSAPPPTVQGLKGQRPGRLQNAADARLRQRIHFYFNRGQGIHPGVRVGAPAPRGAAQRLRRRRRCAQPTARPTHAAGGAVADPGRRVRWLRNARAQPVRHRGAGRPQRRGRASLASRSPSMVGKWRPATTGNIWYSRRSSCPAGAKPGRSMGARSV